MKAILKFNLPDEQEEFDLAINAGDYSFVIWEFSQYLRNQTKYADDNVSEDYLKAMEDCRDEFNKLLYSYNIKL